MRKEIKKVVEQYRTQHMLLMTNSKRLYTNRMNLINNSYLINSLFNKIENIPLDSESNIFDINMAVKEYQEKIEFLKVEIKNIEYKERISYIEDIEFINIISFISAIKINSIEESNSYINEFFQINSMLEELEKDVLEINGSMSRNTGEELLIISNHIKRQKMINKNIEDIVAQIINLNSNLISIYDGIVFELSDDYFSMNSSQQNQLRNISYIMEEASKLLVLQVI